LPEGQGRTEKVKLSERLFLTQICPTFGDEVGVQQDHGGLLCPLASLVLGRT
jgi:hypothetical protein